MANATHGSCGLHRRRTSLLRIHEDLGALGYGGGYDAVRRYARAWRRRRRLLSPSQAFVPLSFDPGEAYQFDWSHEYARLSGVTTRVKAAHMRLCYSQMQLVQIFPREGQEMVLDAHRALCARGRASCALRAWTRIVRSARVDARRTRACLPLLRRGLPARHLRQHEDGGEHGVRGQEAGLQPPLPGDVFAPSGGACRASTRAGAHDVRARPGLAGRRGRSRGRWVTFAAACSCPARGAGPTPRSTSGSWIGASSCALRAWAHHRALRARGRARTPRSIRIRRSRARRCGRCSRSRVHARGAHDGASTRAERTMMRPRARERTMSGPS